MVNIHFSAFLKLNALIRLIISDSSGLNQFRPTDYVPSVFNQHWFFSLKLIDNRLTDESVDHFLKWIGAGPSKETLEELFLNGNALTRIPQEQIKLFYLLNDIRLDHQLDRGLGVVPAFSISFSSYANNPRLSLVSCNITDIQPQAIQGLNF